MISEKTSDIDRAVDAALERLSYHIDCHARFAKGHIARRHEDDFKQLDHDFAQVAKDLGHYVLAIKFHEATYDRILGPDWRKKSSKGPSGSYRARGGSTAYTPSTSQITRIGGYAVL